MVKAIKIGNKIILITKQNEEEYIFLTNMVQYKEGNDHILNCMRNKNTVDFIGFCKTLHNPNFKGIEFKI